jgi:hypothetical protein
VFTCGKSLVKVQPEIPDIFFLVELYVVYKNQGALLSSSGERDVEVLGFVSFYSPFLTSSGLRLGWFPVSLKQWLDHCPWLSTAVIGKGCRGRFCRGLQVFVLKIIGVVTEENLKLYVTTVRHWTTSSEQSSRPKVDSPSAFNSFNL